MAKKQPKLDFVIICDDIREEVSQKLSYIGVYNDIIVSKLPYIFPKLCFSLYYSNISSGDKVSIGVKNPSGKSIVKPVDIVLPTEIKGYSKFTFFAIFSPIEVKEDGAFNLSIIINDDETKITDYPFTIKGPNNNV